MSVENEIISLKDAVISKLESVEKPLLKMLDFYTEEVKEDTIAEVYSVSATTAKDEINSPVFNGKRLHWFWIHIDNLGTGDIRVGINGDAETGIRINSTKSLTLSYNNLKVDLLQYKTISGTADIEIVCLRPKYQGR